MAATRCACSPRRPVVVLDGGRDAEGVQGVEQVFVVGCAGAVVAGGLPLVIVEAIRVESDRATAYQDVRGRRWSRERVGLFDLLADAFGVDGAVVEVAEGHPLVGERTVEFDEPADEVGVRLLPEGFLALAEELVEEGGDGVGKRVAVHGGRQGVPLPAAAEGEFGVVVLPAGVFEVRPDVVAEVSLDFEDESGGPLLRVRGLPREQLLGEGAHAGGGLAGPDGAEDGDPGIQAPLGEREPGGPPDLARLGGMVDFPDHERGRIVVRRRGPARQGPAAKATVPPAGAEPEAVGAGENHDSDEGHDGRHHEVPGADDRVEAGVFELYEVEKGNVTGRGEGTRCDGPRERDEREKDGDDDPPAEKAVGGFGGVGEVVHGKGGNLAGGTPEGRGVADGEAAEGEGDAGRCREVPDAQHRVGDRIFEGDEVEDRNVAGPGERAVAEREVERGECRADGDDEARWPDPRGTPRGAERGWRHHRGAAFPQGSLAP